MTEEAQKLLMMFIDDSYKGSGKPKKKTLLALMKYVASDSELQRAVNDGDSKKILNYTTNK